MKIAVDSFDGEQPKVSPRLLPNNFAQIALNCDLKSGSLKPLKQRTDENAGLSGDVSTLWRWTYNTENAKSNTLSSSALTNFQGVSDGSLRGYVSGTEYIITGVNTTSCASLVSVASVLQASIRAVGDNNETVTYNTGDNTFDFDFQDDAFYVFDTHFDEGTDITTDDYMAVRGKIAITETSWVGFEDFTYVFDSPIINDQYDRLYYLNNNSSFIKVRDNNYQFTPSDRNLWFEIPTEVPEAQETNPPLYGGGSGGSQGSQQYKFQNLSCYICNSSASPSSATLYHKCGALSGVVVGDTLSGHTSNGTSGIFIVDGWHGTNGIDNDSNKPVNGDKQTNVTTTPYSIGTDRNIIEITSNGVRVSSGYAGTTYLAGVSGYFWFDGSYTGPTTDNWVFRRSSSLTYFDILDDTPPTDTSWSIDGRPADGDTYYRSYVYTYVYENGEEGPISPVSNEIIIQPQAEGQLTVLGSTSPSGVIKKRIYCTDNYEWKFVGEIDASSTIYTDTSSTEALGEVLTVNNNPPRTLKGVELSANGFVVGWADKDIYFSEQYIPHGWHDEWSINSKYDIVRCIASGTDIYVLTTGEPSILSGYHPSEIVKSTIPIKQACVSEWGVVTVGKAVVYISPDGLVSLQGSTAKVITQDFFTRDFWQSLTPETMKIGVHDDKVYVFADSATYVVSINEDRGVITQIEHSANAVYEDIVEDKLYIYDNVTDEVYSLHTSSVDEEYQWRSKEYDFKKPIQFACAKVIAEDYNDITLKVYLDGNYTTAVATKSVINDKPFRLPRTKSATLWAFELVGKSEINSVQIASSMQELD